MSENASIENKQIKTSEEKLASLFLRLPKELQDLWMKKIEDMGIDDEEAIILIEKVIVERSNVKEKIFTKISSIKDPELKEQVRVAISTIEGSFGDEELFLGEGTVGKVYFMPKASRVCVKYITDDNMLEKHGNTMRQEVQYLVDLDGFCVEGIRVPIVLFEKENCFGMETIKGMSLDKIIEDPGSCEFLDKIKTQDMSTVIRKMKAFVLKMHESMKIVHRDLATRNIMIDSDGNWYVIDFGKAKRIELGDESKTRMSEQSDLASAEGAIRNLFTKIY